jgi:mono/diheme cytochrome c family protein
MIAALLIGGATIAIALAQAAPGAAGQTGATAARVDFNRDIRPILSDKCFVCHGPDATAKKIKLRLDSEAAATADLSRGRRAIVPGAPDKSEIVKRITHADEDMRMPPASSGRTLTKPEIDLLTEWIRQGAKWQSHWAFVPPVRPQLPPVKNAAWPKNAIDHFVLARLEREGLQPAPEADRATLLRRLSFDLTGLPPTPEELDGFLKDQSPNAYEKVVDRLLASTRYGERMAFKWLDAARYADTNGYQNDGDRYNWRWRDWVIDAFNRNLPFDRFTIEQLAGDLLPKHPDPQRALDQRIATAFNRNHRLNSEDGLIPEEYAVEYVVDRVDTTSTIFLGLTMGCARCHTHKYDPFTHKEYYQLYAYFNSVPEDGRGSYHTSEPWIPAPTNEQQQRLRQIEADIAATSRSLNSMVDTHQKEFRQWTQALPSSGLQQWFPGRNLLLRHSLDANANVEMVAKPEDRKFAGYESAKPDLNAKRQSPGYRYGAPAFVPSPAGQGAAFDGQAFYDAGFVADFDYSDRLYDHRDQFAISVWFHPEAENSGAIVTHMQDKPGEKDGNLPKNRGYGLFFIDGKLHWNIVSVWADDSWRVETGPVALNEWHHVVAIFDGREPYERAQIYLDGHKQKLKLNNGRLFRTFADASANLRIGGGGGPEHRFKGRLDEARVYNALPDAEQLAMLACADSLPAIAAIPARKRTEGQRLKLLNAWLDVAAPPSAHQEWARLHELNRAKAKLEREFPLVMVMEELPAPRTAHILRRGAYDLPGEAVTRGLPASLHSAGKQPANRLEFAEWLVSPENPLTARVQVNRFWQMLFGTGLVKTVEDFGSQGELPSHPELLDWLAVEFMTKDEGGRMKDESTRSLHPSAFRLHPSKSAWDVKALLKTIVMSATYRQSSNVTPQLQQRDPDNRMLARGGRLRLPAEMIRDQALFVSGLLVEKIGGPSVKPYQPAGLLKDMVFSNMTDYAQEKGENLWRRSLYTYWKRTVLNPGMQVFDATAREQCTVRDTRTNTPLQALNLMNDVTYVEAARMLAERMLLGGGTLPEQRLAWAFRAVTSRPPDETERQTLLDNLKAQLSYFREHRREAEKLLTIGEKRNDAKLDAAELAAYATAASLILNLDEAITKQ